MPTPLLKINPTVVAADQNVNVRVPLLLPRKIQVALPSWGPTAIKPPSVALNEIGYIQHSTVKAPLPNSNAVLVAMLRA
jgi:hypothetical protein